MADTLKQTPLHDRHLAAGGKMVPFAGFSMPVQYATGIMAEHRAVRTAAGLFDVSHMGEFFVRGPEALAFLQHLTTNDVSQLAVGQAQYSASLNPEGGVIDDCIVYRYPDHYMVVVNAGNLERDLAWFREHAEGRDMELQDRSAEVGLLALQGPQAQAILARLTDTDLDGIAYYHFAEGEVAGRPATLSRTGYTGEDGFELYLDAADTAHVWDALLEAGADDGLIPAGLGARDGLRLEVGYALHGNDVDDRITPLEAGLGWIVKLGKGDFIGRDALAELKEAGVARKLVGFVMRERGFPRQGYEVRVAGEPAGEVTSGIHSPMLDQGIGMAYVPTEAAKPGTIIHVVIRDKEVPAEVTRPPFYTEGSIKR
ncbi:MAG: glycine cleavage system aminomethyltransferase GcvT [Gemmatimonadota bacterium]